MTLPRVLLLTDRSQLPLGRSLLATVEAAVRVGVDHVVLRELDLPDAQRAGLAEEFLEVGATVIAAHRPVPGCVAVHHPSSSSSRDPRDEDPGVSRRTASAHGVSIRPPARSSLEGYSTSFQRFGRSCHSAAEVRAAAGEGASYATLGPFALTKSKPGYGPPLDPSEYADLPIPTFALGGVGPDNAARALAAGAHGVAVMGAVMRAANPAVTAGALVEVIR